VNIEYFADGAIDTPLILIYGDDPTGVEKLRLVLENLVNGLVDSVAFHEIPGYKSVDECKLFAQIDRDDLGIWRPNKKEPVFICSQQKETWIDVIDKLEPFTEPHTYIYSGGHFQYLTDHIGINLIISTRRSW
jgi:chaperone required for assembly of F1-ATPase